jgi:hypothetical protein
MALIKVGPLPRTQRGTGRKPGTWRGHAEEARQLRALEPGQWGMVLERVQASRAQQIVSAIKNGTAADFRHESDGARYTAHARKSDDQSGAPTNKKGVTVTLYDVWARWLPPGESEDEEDEAQLASVG